MYNLAFKKQKTDDNSLATAAASLWKPNHNNKVNGPTPYTTIILSSLQFCVYELRKKLKFI